jgi:hypothetical protein
MPRIISPSTKALADDADVEIAVTLEDLLGVVEGAARVEHGERALAKQLEDRAAAVEQLRHFRLRQVVEAALGRDARVDDLGVIEEGLHGRRSYGSQSAARAAGVYG